MKLHRANHASHGNVRRPACGVLIVLAVLAAWLLPVASVRAATPKQVDDAIEKAKTYLLGIQQNGNWEDQPLPNSNNGEGGGISALCTYALLSAGVPSNDPKISATVDYLKGVEMRGIYAISFRSQVWISLGDPIRKDVKGMLARDGLKLLNAAHPTADFDGKGFYSYNIEPDEKNPLGYDHSNSQYGVLGVWACADVGFEVPDAYWKAVDAGWRKHQHPNGSWCYKDGGEGWELGESATMTSAGIATLFVSSQFVHAEDGVECRGNIEDKNIEAGLKWITDNFDSIFKSGWAGYGNYGVERIGVASGLKYFGTHDWYKVGADAILATQQADGSFGSNAIETAYDLLFLSRGRAPIVMNKLQYKFDPAAAKIPNWNQRPRDAANVSHWMGKQLEQLLNWQVVTLDVPPEDLHDAPILYLTGNQTLQFTEEDCKKLRTFVEEGGIILGNADCNSREFSDSFEKLGTKLFPYEFNDLPKDNVIFTNEQFILSKSKNPVAIRHMSNGARELMLLFPKGDPSRYWQTRTVGGHEELHEAMADIFLYSVDKQGLAEKGATYIVTADKNPVSRKIKVARLKYPLNWDPEPGGWWRLAAVMHNDLKTDLDVQTVELGTGKLDNSFKAAHLTGTTKFTLTDAARKELAAYLKNGGTLIIDAAGGSGDFAESAKTEIAAILPDSKFEQLRSSDPALAGEKPDDRLEVSFRSFAVKTTNARHSPRILTVRLDGRPAIFLSPDDLSVGLVGQPVDGVIGYTPKSSTEIMSRLLLAK